MFWKIIAWACLLGFGAATWGALQYKQERDTAREECLYRASIQKGLEQAAADVRLLEICRVCTDKCFLVFEWYDQ